MVVNKAQLHYPSVQNCAVVLSSMAADDAGSSSLSAAGSLPSSVVAAASEPLPSSRDFDLERQILADSEDDRGGPGAKMRSLLSSPSPRYPNLTPDQRFKVESMISVTNADEVVCVRLLRKNRYRVDSAVNAFYRGDHR